MSNVISFGRYKGRNTKLDVSTMKLVARAAFTSDSDDPNVRDPELDPDRAADELRQAGYQVFRLPKEYAVWRAHPLDDLIEVHIVGPDDPQVRDAVWHEVDGIVRRHGGSCYVCCCLESDAPPWCELFYSED